MNEELKPPRFPTMLRKMWGGSEVQAWIDENWNRRAQPAWAIDHPDLAARFAAEDAVKAQPEPAERKGADGLPVSAPRLYADEEPPEPAAPADSDCPYYISGPYYNGSYSMCELETGRVLFNTLRNAPKADAAPSVAPEPVCAHGIRRPHECRACADLPQQSDIDAWMKARRRMPDGLRDLIEGMSVSVDVSTGEDDSGNRYFGTVTEVMDDEFDKHGVTLLVQDAKPNFDTPPRAPLEQFDLDQSPDYHKGRADGRAVGYDVGFRHGTEHFKPTRATLTPEQIDAAFRKYGTGRPDGFAAAVRELEAAAHGISAEGEKT